jgi:hypothetical protein
MQSKVWKELKCVGDRPLKAKEQHQAEVIGRWSRRVERDVEVNGK